MCFDEESLLFTLDQLVAVQKCRSEMFDKAGCDSIDKYNEVTGAGLPRLIFACDEVAEMLDRTAGAKRTRTRWAKSKTGWRPWHGWGGPLVFT